MKKLFSVLVSAMMILSTIVVPAKAANTVDAKLYGRVEDNGQAIYKVVLDYGVEVSGVDKDTYTVHAKTSSAYVQKKADGEMAFGDFDKDRVIVDVKVNGTKVEIYLDENDGAAGTLSYYLLAARNVPTEIDYTITQNKAVTTATGTIENPTITVDNKVIDEEVAKFTKKDDVIDYQFYEETGAETLIVWFHGNGEGDYVYDGYSTQNNVAQVLANRGTVAWITDEAQNIFGKAHVMSFQAPNTWYYAQKDHLLEAAYNEIMAEVNARNIKKIIVSGCSAGGYMTTRMIIKYPDLFDAAMINCPALDVATQRGGETPTDIELKTIKNSRTAIWLVQGETDGTVNTEDCSIRLFNILTEGQTITETRVNQDIQSGFNTYETEDGKYKMSLYDTTETGKLMFAEDFDQDGVATYTEFSNHWSWIYTLRNNPIDANGTTIWSWAANYPNVKKAQTVEAEAQLYAEVTDAGQVVNKVVIDYGQGVTVANVDKATYTIHATADTEFITAGTSVISYGDYDIDRKIEKVEVNGSKVTVHLNEAEGATLAYLASGRNFPAEITYTIKDNGKVKLTGNALTAEVVKGAYNVNANIIDEEVEKFKSVIVPNGINYQFYEAAGADSLIVWFHGNGEGDYLASNNNVSQILANRGGVAWATKEAQDIFGKAHVMAFQAPDHWYNAKNNGLLEKAYEEIMDVVEDYDVDTDNIYVSGCSAGGFMTTRMIIKYPDLFAAAMINCPALDIANDRAGVTDATPTDAELESIKNSDTAIWLVQGETDSSVKPEDCSMRLFDILTEGETLTETRVEEEIQSSYTTYETKDGKYKLSIYDTVDVVEDATGRGKGKLVFAEDYNHDGKLEEVKYSDHWSWIYTLRNNPTDASETTIWEWAAHAADASVSTQTGDNAMVTPLAVMAVVALVGAVIAFRKKEELN